MKAMVLGATGLTGRQVLAGLLEAPEVETVVAPVRRPLRTHSKLVQRTVDFDHLAPEADLFAVDAIVCCLGTTMARAGSKAAFRRVDYDVPLEAARLGLENGARAFLLMSAVGASAQSPVFYSRVKGQLEEALADLGYPRLSIYHPGLLLGERQEQRTGESAMGTVMPMLNALLPGPLKRYRGIPASTVARAMVTEVRLLSPSELPDPQVIVRHYDEMESLAAGPLTTPA
ncbi:Rossmann-fold NAD(P)-binding domain-containing protein [Tamilnaduibacter salinus]|uniref:oxidoreductase n=1 Tax=Tamilnaduibacter salinus TaxID=1484056 RepID=UPI001B80CE04|nr:oxidoreductase [Tamilnaduibacter salinus]